MVWDTASNVVVLHKDKVQVECEQKYLTLVVFEMLQVTVEMLQVIVVVLQVLVEVLQGTFKVLQVIVELL